MTTETEGPLIHDLNNARPQLELILIAWNTTSILEDGVGEIRSQEMCWIKVRFKWPLFRNSACSLLEETMNPRALTQGSYSAVLRIKPIKGHGSQQKGVTILDCTVKVTVARINSNKRT